jgi:hypothetical protein
MTTDRHPSQCSDGRPPTGRSRSTTPPVNLFDPEVLSARQDLTTRLGTDNDVQVVVFDSAPV